MITHYLVYIGLGPGNETCMHGNDAIHFDCVMVVLLSFQVLMNKIATKVPTNKQLGLKIFASLHA